MGNCGTKPKTSDGDDAPPPPVEPQTAEGAGPAAEVAAPEPEGTSQPVVAPQIEEATTTTIVEENEPAEPKEKEGEVAKEKETPTTEGTAAELPASTPPASVA